MSSNNFQHYKSLGQLIKDYRQWRKISQDEFAELIKVSVRQLRRWEAGLSHRNTSCSDHLLQLN
ncbi:MAG: helix-turn-helix domain-containing protein [Proteobacteria bacterium]|nr:helix-turn-helix domain-containing protein [Pseudomonadota bacterium]